MIAYSRFFYTNNKRRKRKEFSERRNGRIKRQQMVPRGARNERKENDNINNTKQQGTTRGSSRGSERRYFTTNDTNLHEWVPRRARNERKENDNINNKKQQGTTNNPNAVNPLNRYAAKSLCRSPPRTPNEEKKQVTLPRRKNRLLKKG